jgi:hypothetical protein
VEFTTHDQGASSNSPGLSPVAELIPALGKTVTEPDVNAFLDRLRALSSVLSFNGLEEVLAIATGRLAVVSRVRDPEPRVRLALGLFGSPAPAWPVRTIPRGRSRSISAVFGLLGTDPENPRCPRCLWPLEWAAGPAFPGDPGVGVSVRCMRAGCVLESWAWAAEFVSDALRLSIGQARKQLSEAAPDGRFPFGPGERKTGHRTHSRLLDREWAGSRERLALAGGGTR